MKTLLRPGMFAAVILAPCFAVAAPKVLNNCQPITEPGGMPLTASSVISTGDFLPGIAAVVMTTSVAASVLAISSRCRR